MVPEGTAAYRRLITDRFAPVNDGDPCVVDGGKYCGGNWQTLVGKLDYIQGMGYDAVWISPTGLNIEGQTPYGEAFHVRCSIAQAQAR